MVTPILDNILRLRVFRTRSFVLVCARRCRSRPAVVRVVLSCTSSDKYFFSTFYTVGIVTSRTNTRGVGYTRLCVIVKTFLQDVIAIRPGLSRPATGQYPMDRQFILCFGPLGDLPSSIMCRDLKTYTHSHTHIFIHNFCISVRRVLDSYMTGHFIDYIVITDITS